MSSRVLAVAAVVLAVAPGFAAPQYSSRSRGLRIVMRSGTPAPATAPAPEPKLARVVAQTYRTAPAASPTLPQALPPSIEAEALAKFYPSFQSGGGFMPLALGNRVQSRQDVVIEP